MSYVESRNLSSLGASLTLGTPPGTNAKVDWMIGSSMGRELKAITFTIDSTLVAGKTGVVDFRRTVQADRQIWNAWIPRTIVFEVLEVSGCTHSFQYRFQGDFRDAGYD